MTDAEISKRLALAIGWPADSVWGGAKGAYIVDDFFSYGRQFDYRDPAVIWKIAERFDAFPVFVKTRAYWTARSYSLQGIWVSADTAAKAVALAVIKAKEQK